MDVREPLLRYGDGLNGHGWLPADFGPRAGLAVLLALMSDFMAVQITLDAMSRLVALAPGWAMLWKAAKVLRR